MRKKKYITYINSTIHAEYPLVGMLVDAVNAELAKTEVDSLYDKLIPKHFRIKAMSLQPNYINDQQLATVRLFNTVSCDKAIAVFQMYLDKPADGTPTWKVRGSVDIAKQIYNFMQNEFQRWKEHNIDVREGLELWLAVNS